MPRHHASSASRFAYDSKQKKYLPFFEIASLSRSQHHLNISEDGRYMAMPVNNEELTAFSHMQLAYEAHRGVCKAKCGDSQHPSSISYLPKVVGKYKSPSDGTYLVYRSFFPFHLSPTINIHDSLTFVRFEIVPAGMVIELRMWPSHKYQCPLACHDQHIARALREGGIFLEATVRKRELRQLKKDIKFLASSMTGYTLLMAIKEKPFIDLPLHQRKYKVLYGQLRPKHSSTPIPVQCFVALDDFAKQMAFTEMGVLSRWDDGDGDKLIFPDA